LFEDEPGPVAPLQHCRGPMLRDRQHELTELDYTTAVRLVREAACPSRHNTPRKIDLLRRVRVPRVVGTDWMRCMICGTMGEKYAVGVDRGGMVGCGGGEKHFENISTVTTAAREGRIIKGEIKA